MIILILIIINIINIFYIYLKYYKSNQFINEDIKDKESIIIGYINDKGVDNNFDLILAEIIELNIKGYIVIEYSEDKIDEYNYIIKQNIPTGSDKLTTYEMLILNFLFPNKMEITKIELEDKLRNTFSSYNVQFNEVGNILNKQLEKEYIIDKYKQKEFYKKVKRYIIVSIILVLLVSILGILKVIEVPVLYILVYILEKVISSALLLKADLYTNNGKNIEYSIKKYKSELKEKEFLTDKNTMKDIVMDKKFADSIALHINTQAKKEFIDDKLAQEISKMSKKQVINALIIFSIIILAGLIIAGITMILPHKLIFWFYLIICIAIACTADITHLLNDKKK